VCAHRFRNVGRWCGRTRVRGQAARIAADERDGEMLVTAGGGGLARWRRLPRSELLSAPGCAAESRACAFVALAQCGTRRRLRPDLRAPQIIIEPVFADARLAAVYAEAAALMARRACADGWSRLEHRRSESGSKFDQHLAQKRTDEIRAREVRR